MALSKLNGDCIGGVVAFCDTAALSALMAADKYLNNKAMDYLCGRYGIKIVETKKVKHMGMLLTSRNQEIAKRCFVRSLANSVAVLSKKCMLCGRTCRSICVYGFMAHSSCVSAKEVVVYNKNSPITRKTLRHIHGLRMRALKVSGETHYAIGEGIPGVYPHTLSLHGYIANNSVEIDRAHEIVARQERIEAEEEKKRRDAQQKRELATITDIERITGKSYCEWCREVAEDTGLELTRWLNFRVKPTTDDEDQPRGDYKEAGAAKLPSYFLSYAPRFNTGADALRAVREFQDNLFLTRDMSYILHSTDESVIDYEVVATKITEKKDRHEKEKAAGKVEQV